MNTRVTILCAALLITGCAKYKTERKSPVLLRFPGSTNYVVAFKEETTGIVSFGSKTGLEGVTSEVTDGDYQRKVGASAVKTQGDADLVRASSEGATTAALKYFGGPAGPALQSTRSAPPQIPPATPGQVQLQAAPRSELRLGGTNNAPIKQ